MGIEQQGSLAFRVKHEDKDWSTNNKRYQFPAFRVEGISAWVVKKPDKVIEFHVNGPFNSELVFDGKCPPVGPEGLHVMISWSPQEVKLYLNGKPIGVDREAPKPPKGGAAKGNGAGNGAGAAPADPGPTPPDA